MVRSPRGPTFFACAKKVGKETHPWRRALRFAPGPQSAREFPEGASCPCRKRRTSLCAALRVLPGPLATPERGPERPKQQQNNSNSRLSRTGEALWLLALALGPPPQRWRRWANPQGAAHDARRFGSAHGCAVPKFPSATRTPAAQRLGREDRGVLSLVPFFAQAKKGTPRGERAIVDYREQQPRQRQPLNAKEQNLSTKRDTPSLLCHQINHPQTQKSRAHARLFFHHHKEAGLNPATSPPRSPSRR